MTTPRMRTTTAIATIAATAAINVTVKMTENSGVKACHQHP